MESWVWSIRGHRGAPINLYTACVDQADSTRNARRGALHFGVAVEVNVCRLMLVTVKDNEPLLVSLDTYRFPDKKSLWMRSRVG